MITLMFAVCIGTECQDVRVVSGSAQKLRAERIALGPDILRKPNHIGTPAILISK